MALKDEEINLKMNQLKVQLKFELAQFELKKVDLEMRVFEKRLKDKVSDDSFDEKADKSVSFEIESKLKVEESRFFDNPVDSNDVAHEGIDESLAFSKNLAHVPCSRDIARRIFETGHSI